MADTGAIWNLRSEHSGTFLRLQRLLEGRRSFTLCFLTYSDSFYRDRAASFLEKRLDANVRVSIDPDTAIGTEDLFERLSAAPPNSPSQLMGLEHWPEGIDNLLTRLNYRREALAERCPRPLLFWVLSRDLNKVTTKAADLWAWRSGVFDFTLPADTRSRLPHRSRIDPWVAADTPRRRARMEELQQYLAARPSLRPIDVDLLLELGDLRRDFGELAQAEGAYLRAEKALSDTDDQRRRAITRGRIADLLEIRGQLEEALHIRIEVELPVYEKLDDIRSIAITKGQIANILQTRGQLDEALRIRTEEELPVYEKIGDTRALAIAHGRIADILEIRGQLDEALRVRTEKQLPVFKKIGDAHSVAITRGRIADILEIRGQLDEALRIRTEEELPVYEKLGDVRSVAITRGEMADILAARGQVEEALRIRLEEEIPVYEKFGDVRALAIAHGRIADIHEIRGQLDEALRIRTEEELPVYEKLGDVRLIVFTRAQIAGILAARGRVGEALRIYERDVLRDIKALGDPAQIERVRKRIASLRESLRELSKGSLGR